MSEIWIAADGTYGQGKVASIDTTDWTQNDFNDLAESPDCTRMKLAFVISASYVARKLR